MAQSTIFQDALTQEDWEILRKYRDLLEPCWMATLDLQGRPVDGKTSILANVLLDLEFLVERLTREYNHYKDARNDVLEGQWHFSTQIKLALDKAEEYYAKLDSSPAYIAAVILHPRYNMKYLESQWATRKTWITRAKREVKALWLSTYKQQPISEAISPQKSKAIGCELNMVEAYREAGITKADEHSQRQTISDEFERYCLQDRVETKHPIDWWQTTGYNLYPRLAQMAIDILSIPAMSDEPERIFSRLGLMITKRRNRLDQDVIQATTCLYSWDSGGLIDLRNTPP